MKIGLFDYAKNDRPLLAIVLLLIATFTLAFQDALIKLMSVETSFWQFQVLRSSGNLFLLLMLAGFTSGFGLLVPQNKPGVLLRALFLAICMFFFFSGAPFLSVSQMGAGLYTYPIFVCLLAGPILGEIIGWWRIFSICFGTAGALLMLSPWKEDFSAVQLLPIVAGFFYACNILTLRSACRHESTLALAFVAGSVFLISGLGGIAVLFYLPLGQEVQQSMPFVAIGWPTLTLAVTVFAILASVLNLTGNICLTRAYQTADASLLAPLDFSYLLFGTIWGKALFDRWPAPHTLLGMTLIIFAGATIAWREQLRSTPQVTGR